MSTNSEVTTTPTDVRAHIDTDLPDELSEGESGLSVSWYIDEAAGEALTYNDLRDFEPGELDRLVKFYAALMISNKQRSGGEKKQMRQGSRQVTLSTPSDTRDRTGWLRGKVRANDPSGKILGGRSNKRNVTFTEPDHDPYDAGYPEREDTEDV